MGALSLYTFIALRKQLNFKSILSTGDRYLSFSSELWILYY